MKDSGDGDVVGRVLASAEEAMERHYALRARGVDLAFTCLQGIGRAGCEAERGVGLREVSADC